MKGNCEFIFPNKLPATEPKAIDRLLEACAWLKGVYAHADSNNTCKKCNEPIFIFETPWLIEIECGCGVREIEKL